MDINDTKNGKKDDSVAEDNSPRYTCLSDFLQGDTNFMSEDDVDSFASSISIMYGEDPDGDSGVAGYVGLEGDQKWNYPDPETIDFVTTIPTGTEGEN